MHHRVEPAARLYVVEARDHDVELLVEIGREILDEIGVVSDLHPRASLHHKLGSNLRLVIADIVLPNVRFRKDEGGMGLLPKKELPVQIGHINLVQIDDMNIFEAAQCQVLQKLTAKATSAYNIIGLIGDGLSVTNDEYFRELLHHVSQL